MFLLFIYLFYFFVLGFHNYIQDVDGNIPEVCSIERENYLQEILQNEQVIYEITRVLTEDQLKINPFLEIFQQTTNNKFCDENSNSNVDNSNFDDNIETNIINQSPSTNRRRSISFSEGFDLQNKIHSTTSPSPSSSSSSSLPYHNSSRDIFAGVWGGSLDLNLNTTPSSKSNLQTSIVTPINENITNIENNNQKTSIILKDNEINHKNYNLSISGISPSDLKIAGYTAEELRLHGFSAPQLIGAGNNINYYFIYFL